MKPWKAAVGVGAACAACCAVPLLGGAAMLTAGTATLAGLGSALMACADELAPLAFVLLGLAAVGVGVGVLLWRRKTKRPTPAAADEPPAAACGCAPGACGAPTIAP